jgi:hypothetical protein
MATRLYLSAAAETVPISPAPDSGWEDISILARCLCGTSKRGLAMTTVSFSDANYANKDILFRQYISPPLVPGVLLTFPGGDEAVPIYASCRVLESGSSNNMFFTLGIRIIASNGTTVRRTLLNVTRDYLEASDTLFQSRAINDADGVFCSTGSYTTQAGDRLVIEIGMGGDPV